MSDQPEGFYAPVHRSLTTPMLYAGVPRNVAITLGMAAALFGLGWHIYSLLPVVGVAYFAAVWVCKRDPHAFSIIQQNSGPRRYLP